MSKRTPLHIITINRKCGSITGNPLADANITANINPHTAILTDGIYKYESNVAAQSESYVYAFFIPISPSVCHTSSRLPPFAISGIFSYYITPIFNTLTRGYHNFCYAGGIPTHVVSKDEYYNERQPGYYSDHKGHAHYKKPKEILNHPNLSFNPSYIILCNSICFSFVRYLVSKHGLNPPSFPTR